MTIFPSVVDEMNQVVWYDSLISLTHGLGWSVDEGNQDADMNYRML